MARVLEGGLYAGFEGFEGFEGLTSDLVAGLYTKGGLNADLVKGLVKLFILDISVRSKGIIK